MHDGLLNSLYCSDAHEHHQQETLTVLLLPSVSSAISDVRWLETQWNRFVNTVCSRVAVGSQQEGNPTEGPHQPSPRALSQLLVLHLYGHHNSAW